VDTACMNYSLRLIRRILVQYEDFVEEAGLSRFSAFIELDTKSCKVLANSRSRTFF
jgi:hypothetical protein